MQQVTGNLASDIATLAIELGRLGERFPIATSSAFAQVNFRGDFIGLAIMLERLLNPAKLSLTDARRMLGPDDLDPRYHSTAIAILDAMEQLLVAFGVPQIAEGEVANCGTATVFGKCEPSLPKVDAILWKSLSSAGKSMRSAGAAPMQSALECYVTLQQMAAIVNRSKRHLERITTKLPSPAIKGGRGKPAEWKWSEVRPELERLYGRDLPAVFPGERFLRS